MATEAKHAAENKHAKTTEERVVESTQAFWSKNSKVLTIVLVVIVLLAAGWVAYKNYFKAPAEAKANDMIWYSELDFKKDSFDLALKGNQSTEHPGFLKVISRNSGTEAANLAKFYAGACYMQLGDFKNAIKYLEDFSTNEPEAKLRATGLLGDAYSELGQNEKAIDNYKKASSVFEKDPLNSSEYLFRAAQLYEKMGKNQEAISTYKDLKKRFPLSNHVTSGEADKYMAKLGYTLQ